MEYWRSGVGKDNTYLALERKESFPLVSNVRNILKSDDSQKHAICGKKLVKRDQRVGEEESLIPGWHETSAVLRSVTKGKSYHRWNLEMVIDLTSVELDSLDTQGNAK